MELENLENLRKIIEDKLILKGMDEDIALQLADEVVESYKELVEDGVDYASEYD